MSFADKFDSLDEDSQSQILTLLHEVKGEQHFSLEENAALENLMLEAALNQCNPEDIASADEVRQVFEKLGR